MATKDISDFQVVRAQQQWKNNPDGPWGYEILEKETGEPQKVCLCALERAASKGLLDYGVSLRTAWLTTSGLMLLDGRIN